MADIPQVVLSGLEELQADQNAVADAKTANDAAVSGLAKANADAVKIVSDATAVKDAADKSLAFTTKTRDDKRKAILDLIQATYQ